MADDHDVTCSDIRKKLKAFLEDLLAEGEYQAFVTHLDGCGECKDYVRKIGSISNQLRELGDVQAPSDLGSTILFRLKQDGEEIRKPKFVISKKLGIGLLIVILVVSTLFFGIKYLKYSRPKEINDTPVIMTFAERKDALTDQEAELLLEKLEKIAEMLNTNKQKETYEIAAVEPEPYHWHMIFPVESRPKVLDMIQETKGTINYESESLIVFSVPVTEARRLRSKIDETELTEDLLFSNFGDLDKEGNLSGEGPIKISIYFSRK